VGACALVLCITPVVAQADSSDPTARLKRYVTSMRRDESVIRFFSEHQWLLSDSRFSTEAHFRLAKARHHLALTQANATRARRELARHRQKLAAKKESRRLASLNAAPRKAICHVFGNHYCGEALAVARCESRLSTKAQNGQYLGLFQMGSSERHLFGHGATAIQQSRAAHRYFMRSGRDWSPWSCKPWR
jgi:hypothetical protein